MSYDKKISRATPGLVLLLLDDSGSMSENLAGTSDPKFMWVERYVGHILKECLARSTELKGDKAEIKPRYFIYVILYGTKPKVWSNGEMDIQAAIELYANANNKLGLGGHLEGTDSASAFQLACDYLSQAVLGERFRHSFPPLLIHITDGKSATDATPIAERVKQLSTEDDRVLVLNGYIGTQTSLAYKGTEDFPGYVELAEVGHDDDNIRLFNMSSEVPLTIRQNLIDDQIFPNLREKARLFFDVRTRETLKHVLQVVGSMGSRADRIVR